MKRQTGAGGLFIGVILVLLIVGILASIAYLRRGAQGERLAQDARRFEAVQTSLVQFISANGRLPCPANPALDTGDELPVVPTGTCSFPQGSVPWKTLGAKRDDAIDAWGWKISYRVYTGTAGSLTQPNGANMASCDTAETAGWSA